MVQQKSAATAPPDSDRIRPPLAADLHQRPLPTPMRLVCIENVNRSVTAAANGSNQIALRCPRLPVINALTCLDDLY